MKELTIEGLQESLRGTYDLTDTVDCQSVIRMLLRDLNAANARSEKAEHDLKRLAFATRHNPAKADELAGEVLDRNKVPGEKVMAFLERMAEEVTRAEDLTDIELTDEVFQHVWGDLDCDSRPSAVLEELLRRFRKHTGQEEDDEETEETP